MVFRNNPLINYFASFNALLIKALTALITTILAFLSTSSITLLNVFFSIVDGNHGAQRLWRPQACF